MKKFFSLLKAVMSQDMNIFVYRSKKDSSRFSKIMMPLLLALLVMYAVGSMYLPLAMELKKENLTYLLLSLALAFPSILALVEGIYKSQGIIFEAKDSNLLMSLPISSKLILIMRVIKLYVFQLLYSLLFVIPGILIYIYYERPDPYFYLITLISLVLFPIIPTVIGCFIGFYIQKISVKFKSKKLVQTAITFALILLFMAFSFKIQDITNALIENANEVKDTISNIYYPIAAYNSLLESFNIFELLKLLAINGVFVAIFVLFASRSYSNVLSKSKEHYTKNKKVDINTLNYKQKSHISSLLKKEFNRYTSSTVYMINTLFGLVLLIIATISLCINFDSAISSIASDEISVDDLNLLRMLAPKVFLAIITAMSFMTSITSSSISLEGKSFNISKSLPVKTEKLLLAKILMSNIITIPVILICDIIFVASFKVNIIDIITILTASFMAPSIAATFGLIVNLKYPKMDASSDSEVVKQSMSSMVSVFGGILLASIFGLLTFFLAGFGDIAILFEVVLLIAIFFVLWIILKKYGNKRYREIEV